MKTLVLAPQSFFVERGTPIAVKMLIETLEKKADLDLSILTYHEGKNVSFNKAKHYRAYIPSFLKDIPTGISLKKVIADIFFTIATFKLLLSAKKKYTLVHAVEESVFIAIIIKLLFKINYIYDMDSPIAEQLSDKWKFLKPLQACLNLFEKQAIKNALAVLPMCEALGDYAKENGAKKVTVLKDISSYDENVQVSESKNIRNIINAKPEDLIILYVGNLAIYQGIDLLVESFAVVSQEVEHARLVIIGGDAEDITKYQQKAKKLGIDHAAYFIGPRPVQDLSIYLKQADILASPRTLGNNTALKVYSYLHSGKVVLATDLPTNTQAMDANTAQLAEPNIEDYAEKLKELLLDKELRERLGKAAQELAEKEYTRESFERTLLGFYGELG